MILRCIQIRYWMRWNIGVLENDVPVIVATRFDTRILIANKGRKTAVVAGTIGSSCSVLNFLPGTTCSLRAQFPLVTTKRNVPYWVFAFEQDLQSPSDPLNPGAGLLRGISVFQYLECCTTTLAYFITGYCFVHGIICLNAPFQIAQVFRMIGDRSKVQWTGHFYDAVMKWNFLATGKIIGIFGHCSDTLLIGIGRQ